MEIREYTQKHTGAVKLLRGNYKRSPRGQPVATNSNPATRPNTRNIVAKIYSKTTKTVK